MLVALFDSESLLDCVVAVAASLNLVWLDPVPFADLIFARAGPEILNRWVLKPAVHCCWLSLLPREPENSWPELAGAPGCRIYDKGC